MLDDPARLRELERAPATRAFVERYAAARTANKSRLASLLRAATGVQVDPRALFDVHIKRIHEYKRQLLNILETIALYQEIRARPDEDFVPRVKIFAGKAAASYDARQADHQARQRRRRASSTPTRRSAAGSRWCSCRTTASASPRQIIPAADVSEQISTAGMEASGTGNMKLALNGALTIGTLDGANIEIREHVGADNIVIFGLTAAEVAEKVDERFEGVDGGRAFAAAAEGRCSARRRRILARRSGPLCADRAVAARL